jgi:hypothetical protein
MLELRREAHADFEGICHVGQAYAVGDSDR